MKRKLHSLFPLQTVVKVRDFVRRLRGTTQKRKDGTADGRIWDSARGPGLQDLTSLLSHPRKGLRPRSEALPCPARGKPPRGWGGAGGGRPGDPLWARRLLVSLCTTPALGGGHAHLFYGKQYQVGWKGLQMSTQMTLDDNRPQSGPCHSPSVVLRGKELLPPTPSPAHPRPHQQDSLEMPTTFLVVTSQRTVLARKAKDTAEHP